MLPLQRCCPSNDAASTTMLPLQRCCPYNDAAPTTMLPLQRCCPYNDAAPPTTPERGKEVRLRSLRRTTSTASTLSFGISLSRNRFLFPFPCSPHEMDLQDVHVTRWSVSFDRFSITSLRPKWRRRPKHERDQRSRGQGAPYRRGWRASG
eukprot:scaffold1234_cov248-Pinguiococcus_pyrenoidosus.AAC.1